MTLAVATASDTPAVPLSRDTDAQLEAAVHRELVAGDLANALQQYQAILAQPGVSRPVTARALSGAAQCLEKLGRRREARVYYTRVVREYADQKDSAAEARLKLAAWTDAPPGPRNLTFADAGAGDVPAGWLISSGHTTRRQRIQLHGTGCRDAGTCVTIAGTLSQSFSAMAYRGKTIRVRTFLRSDPPTTYDAARLWLRIENEGARRKPVREERAVVSTQWTPAEIVSEIDSSADIVEFGISSPGAERVWVDEVSFEVVPQSEVAAARVAVSKLYQRLDIAYTDGAFDDDLRAIGRHTRYRAYEGNNPFRELLERRRADGESDDAARIRTNLLSFRLSETGAVTTVRVEFSGSSGGRELDGITTFRDIWRRTNSSWILNERVFLTGHFVTPRTDAGTARLVAADLKQLAAPLAAAEAGHTLYDLAPFGTAVGDARIVALGDAASGTRESCQLRHRLIEYLVKEKGFSAVIVAGDPDKARAIDRYIKTGMGHPERELPGLNSWVWATEQALELVEWMRKYNTAHPGVQTLSFAAARVHDHGHDAAPPQAGTMAERLGHLSGTEHAGRRIVLLTTNLDIALSSAGRNSIGEQLRDRFGKQLYVVGFALQQGAVRAGGISNGETAGLANHAIRGLPEGTGDWVLSAAGMPLFFVDLTAIPPMTTLGLWLSRPHLFLYVGATWNQDDAENHLYMHTLPKMYDALIFVRDVHPVRPLEARHASTY